MRLLRNCFKKPQRLPLFFLPLGLFHSLQECCQQRSLPGHSTPQDWVLYQEGLAMGCRAHHGLCIRSWTVTALPIVSLLAPSADLHSLGSTCRNMHLHHTEIRSATLLGWLSPLHSTFSQLQDHTTSNFLLWYLLSALLLENPNESGKDAFGPPG